MIARAAAFTLYFQSNTTAGAANTATTPTVNLSKDSGAPAASTNAAVHVSNGLWKVALTATEMTADVVGWVASATGCVPVGGTIATEAAYTTTRAGNLDNLDATVGSRLAAAGYTAPLDAAGVRTAIGLAAANLDTQLTAIDDAVDTEVAAVLAAVDTEVAAIKAKTDQLAFTIAGRVDAHAISTATGAIDGLSLHADALADIAQAVWRLTGEIDGLTPKQALYLCLAVAAGKLSGAGTATEIIRNYADTANAITATVDASGNRTAITFVLP